MMHRFNGMSRRLIQLAAATLILIPALASAAQVRWTFSNVKFNDGGTVSGYFIYDADNDTYDDFAVAVTTGTDPAFTRLIYDNSTANVYDDNIGDVGNRFVFSTNDNSRNLRITPVAKLTNAGGTVAMDIATASNNSGSVECFNCGPARNITGGSFVGTPIVSRFAVRPSLTGNWYDPAQDGHGFQFEVLPGGIVTAFWFTFDKNGNQVWISGAGRMLKDSVVMFAGRGLNGRFPPNFNPANVTKSPWGTFTLRFDDCDRAHVDWSSTDAAFTPSGTMNVQRLTSIDGLTCS